MGFDLACAFVAVVFATLGLVRGLFRQVFGLLGLLGGVLMARLFAQPFGETFAKDLGLSVDVAVAASSVVFFLAVAVAASLTGKALHRSLQADFSRGVDRLGGLFVGLAKGALITWALASLVALVRPHLRDVESIGPIAKLDLKRSHMLEFASRTNLISEFQGATDREKLRRKLSEVAP